MRRWRFTLAAICLAAATPGAAQTSINLPIAPGLWTNDTEKCATVRHGYVFDGKNWGALYFYGPNGTLGPAAELEPITQTRSVGGGYIQLQFGGYDGAGYHRVKSLGANRAIYRVGSPFREEIQESDEALIRCTYQMVSPKMKAAIQRHAPTLVSVK